MVSISFLHLSKLAYLKSLSSKSNVWSPLRAVFQAFTKSPVNTLLFSFTLKLFRHSLVKHTGKATSGNYNVKQLQLTVFNKCPVHRTRIETVISK